MVRVFYLLFYFFRPSFFDKSKAEYIFMGSSKLKCRFNCYLCILSISNQCNIHSIFYNVFKTYIFMTANLLLMMINNGAKYFLHLINALISNLMVESVIASQLE